MVIPDISTPMRYDGNRQLEAYENRVRFAAERYKLVYAGLE
jgi:hypothetical protein